METETMTMRTTVHRVPRGSGTLTANCGAPLGAGTIGMYGDRPLLLANDWQGCAAGCYPTPKHRADLTPQQVSLLEVTRPVPLEGPRHRAEGVAA